MPLEKDQLNNYENRFGQNYGENNTFFNDEISRSYSSGINAPGVSTNLLRVYSRHNVHSQGSLKVRSSPSSPNRLSRLQCTTQINKKWSALSKVNKSSSSELEQTNLQISNKSCELIYTDQLDLPKNHLLPLSVPSSRDSSWKNLQLTLDLEACQTKKELFTFGRTLIKNEESLLEKRIEKIENDNSENIKYSSQFTEDGDGNLGKFSFSPTKLPSNPINFKKVMRDRYLNSQKSSITSTTLSSTSSSQNATQNKSRSLLTNESLSSEPEDHNFHFIPDLDIPTSSDEPDKYQTKFEFDVYRSRNALSLDLINLPMPKKYRIKSNNSTVSSMSGIEPESDVFSPASIEICSPLLKLNIPYRNTSCKDSELPGRNLIPSSSLTTLSSVTEADNCFIKSKESKSVQRFFPDSMKISDFNHTRSTNSESRYDQRYYDHLTLPEFSIHRTTSQSTSQYIELNSKGINTLTTSFSPQNTDGVILCNYNQSKVSLETTICPSTFDTNSVKRISNSRSMDHIMTYRREENENDISRSFESDIYETSKWDHSNNKESFSISKPNSNLRMKTKSISKTKKTSTSSTSANQKQCHICGRHFNRSDMLARHIRVHTGHKPFECSICGQSFSRSDHLNTHLRIHSGEKPYRCSICSYSACRRDMITRHLRVHKRKGDIISESNSSFVLNVNKQKVSQCSKNSKVRSNNSLNLDPNDYGDMKETISALYRSRSFTDTDQTNRFNEQDNSFSSVSPVNSPTVTTRTFGNISISISQPTPRSSFSIPMDTQNY